MQVNLLWFLHCGAVEFELRQLECFSTKAQARVRIAEWIEECNHDRRHSSVGMLSPITFELDRAQQRGQEQEDAA